MADVPNDGPDFEELQDAVTLVMTESRTWTETTGCTVQEWLEQWTEGRPGEWHYTPSASFLERLA